MRKRAFLMLAVILLSSCANGNVDGLLRTYNDPSDDAPAADSYRTPYAIYLSWQEDEAADGFILLRADDDGCYDFRELYRGTGTAYADRFTGLESVERYVYRLDKVRGEMLFKGSRLVPAVSTSAVRDEYEDNGAMERATLLETECRASLTVCRYVHEDTLDCDEDWYAVYIRPHRKAYVMLEQLDYGGAVSTLASGADTDFYRMSEDGSSAPIQNKVKFVLENDGHRARNVCFKVYPDMANVLPEGAGTRILLYQVTLEEEVP